MKKLILSSILVLASLAAYSSPATITYTGDNAPLFNLDILYLNTVENSALSINTGYPGYISYNCSLVMRTKDSSSMQAFMDRVDISLIGAKEPTPEVKGSIIWPLVQGGYLGGIIIKTKDGKSIASNVALSFPGQTAPAIGVYADACHRKPKDSPV